MSHSARRVRTLMWGMVVPHSFVLLGRALRNRLLASRRVERFGAGADASRTARDGPRPFDYEEGVGLLVALGCSEDAVRAGSIQDGSLQFIHRTIRERLPRATPLQALHVGNFVGLSLASLTSALVERDGRSTVVSIDPNIAHGGIEQTQGYTLALLEHFGLQDNSLLVWGYTLEKVLGNDAVSHSRYDPQQAYAREVGCENALVSLARLGTRFSVALMDGHHDAGYLRREVSLVSEMLEEGGLLFLDDVSVVWRGIRELFKELGEDSAWTFEQVGYDGRVGALRKVAGESERARGQGDMMVAGLAP